LDPNPGPEAQSEWRTDLFGARVRPTHSCGRATLGQMLKLILNESQTSTVVALRAERLRIVIALYPERLPMVIASCAGRLRVIVALCAERLQNQNMAFKHS
jgi:hypothetical protein